MKTNLLSSSSQIKSGAALSYSAIIITNIVGVLLTPFIIRILGKEEYGLYVLIGSFVSYVTILDFGLNNAIVRYIAKYRAEGDKSGENAFLATVMLMYGAIAFLVVIMGSLIYFNLDSVFDASLTTQELRKAKIMFAILILNLAITIPGGTYSAICNGYEQFVFPRTVTLVRYLVRSAMLVGILWMGGKAISIVVLDTLVNMSAVVVNGYFVTNRIKVKINFHNADLSLVRKTLGYSVWIFVFAVVGHLHWQSGQVVLGIVSGTQAVAVYGVGVMLGTYYSSFSGAISSLFLPKATRMVTDLATPEELTNMTIKIGRVSLLILLYILGSFVLFGRDFIELWVGVAFRESWPVALLIMIGYTTPLVQSFANSLLEARALLSFKALLYLAMTAVGILVGALLAREYGVVGMVVGSTATWMASQVIMNFFFQRVLKLNVRRFFQELLSKILISFFVVMVVCSLLLFRVEKGWITFATNVLIYSVVYTTAMILYGMTPSEKNLIMVHFRRSQQGESDTSLLLRSAALESAKSASVQPGQH